MSIGGTPEETEKIVKSVEVILKACMEAKMTERQMLGAICMLAGQQLADTSSTDQEFKDNVNQFDFHLRQVAGACWRTR